MSHELRTPLNSIIGFANVLLRKTTEAFGARERTYAERVAANGQLLLELVNRILDLSKIDRGTVDVQRGAVHVSDLARSVCDNLVPQASAARVTLELAAANASCGDQPPAPLETDERKLRQILTNLVGNAIKFTPAGGHVRVAVLCHPITGSPQRIDVADTGIGIPPEAQQRVFEAFEQATSDTAATYGGTGLGLSISRGLCQALGFRLTLASTVGVGSTFSVHLAPATVID
jgi:two-component system sensor histidine kinase EvgS